MFYLSKESTFGSINFLYCFPDINFIAFCSTLYYFSYVCHLLKSFLSLQIPKVEAYIIEVFFLF